MTLNRLAYIPLATYPEAISDDSIRAAVAFAVALECSLSVTTFATIVPSRSSGLGDVFLDLPGMVRAAEEMSKAECLRLQGVVQKVDAGTVSAGRPNVHVTQREVVLGAVPNVAAAEARYFDLAVLPWSGETVAAQDLAQAVVFGCGRPTILVPPGAELAQLNNIAIAWDGSRVAARALGDALPLLAGGGSVSVLTVRDEKPLDEQNPAGALASSLEKRGIRAKPIEVRLSDRNIGRALQDAALSEGAQILAMGGFGHSRIRDLVLGGATKGVLRDLRLPTLLSH